MSHDFHPESQSLLNLRSTSESKPYYEYPAIAAVRERSCLVSKAVQGEYPEFPGRRSEIHVPTAHGGVPVYVYRNDRLPANPPVVVYFHGGGMTIGSRQHVDTLCRILAHRSESVVMNVEYRLAPEHPYPAMMDDGCDVTRWALHHREEYGAGPLSRVGVAGDSAGGQIAASVCHDVTGVAFQILVYPHMLSERDYTSPSYQTYKDGPILDLKLIEWFQSLYCPVGEERNPRLVPSLRAEFSSLPPALILPAQHDPIHDDSYAYREKMVAAGVVCELFMAPGSLHGYFTLPGHFKELTKIPYEKTIQFIKKYGTRTGHDDA